ncbi:hypothetical protein Dsin_016100 [Dipteronia sinensis]|uniref:Uncharacterized protein n=1 Tax=Dipteronia sinensis TaxID=43782 RepID=A0AAE0ACS1_9ROSI|nr:hypothetical protein Dsin_016100 [Dipteronia sinensis]
MDQIRNIMMQHEALFKEQVQALHKLYSIQTLAMQEIRRRACSQAQVLTFSSEKVLLKDGPSKCSILEGKPLRPAYATGLAYKEEYLALSLRPFVTLREFEGSSGSFLVENENFCTVERKPMRNLDLEKLPEEYMDEPSEMADVKSTPSQRTNDTEVISVVGANLFVASEQINLNIDQSSEDEAFEVDDVKKCVTSSLESNSATEKNASKEPTVGSSDTFQDLSPSTNGDTEMATLLHQGSSILMTGSNALNFKEVRHDRVLELSKGSSCPGSSEKHQDVGFDSTITRSPKLEESNCYNSGDSLPKNLSSCYQGSSNSNSLHSEPKDDGKNDNPKNLSDGSNSVLSQDTTSCKNENNSHDGREASESECTTGDATGKPSVHEECESIAAEILLSFAPPSRKRVDSQFHCIQAKSDDSSKCCRDNDSNRNLYRTLYPNYSQAGDTNESTTWTKSVSRRRTSRRAR